MILATNTVLRKQHYAECPISECTKEHHKAFERILPDARDAATGSPLSWIRNQLRGTDYDEVVVTGAFYPKRQQGFYHRAGGTFYQDTCCWHINADGTQAEFVVHLNHGEEVLTNGVIHDLRGTTRETTPMLHDTGHVLYFYEGTIDPISLEDALELVYGK